MTFVIIRRVFIVVLLVLLSCSWAVSALATVGPALTVDASAATRHAISPYIYGMNFATEAMATELKLPVRRWGGNATTRYNWQTDMSNHASDWFFENLQESDTIPPGLPDGSAADLFIEQDRRTSPKTLVTMPLIGWTPKHDSANKACGFSVALYGAQQSTDSQYAPDCGNGVHTNGSNITVNNPTDTSEPFDSSSATAWMTYLTGKYGTAANVGVQFYSLDHEPDLWHE